MRLSKLKLMNYRCFGSVEQIIMIDNLTTRESYCTTSAG